MEEFTFHELHQFNNDNFQDIVEELAKSKVNVFFKDESGKLNKKCD